MDEGTENRSNRSAHGEIRMEKYAVGARGKERKKGAEKQEGKKV